MNKNKIHSDYLSELNQRKIDYPDFKSLGRNSMIKFIESNCGLQKYCSKKELDTAYSERSDIELEIWCKELYSNVQSSLKRLVTSKPFLTISIISDEEKVVLS